MIVSHIRNEKAPVEVKEEVPKKSFWSFLKRKKRKSVYSEQKEKRERLQPPAEKDRKVSTASILHSLNRELTGRQETERERLLVQMERLFNNNMALNCRLYGIIRDFELETDRRLEERYMQFFKARERSFYTVSTFAVFIIADYFTLYHHTSGVEPAKPIPASAGSFQQGKHGAPPIQKAYDADYRP